MNIFDFILKREFEQDLKKSFLLNIYHKEKFRVQRYYIRYYRVKGTTVEIVVGVCEIRPYMYALFFATKQDRLDVVGITAGRNKEFMRILEQDFEKNIKHKLDLVLADSDKEGREFDVPREYIYSDNIKHMRRCYIQRVKAADGVETVDGVAEAADGVETVGGVAEAAVGEVVSPAQNVEGEVGSSAEYEVHLDMLDLLGYAEDNFIVQDMCKWVASDVVPRFDSLEAATEYAKEAVNRVIIFSADVIAALKDAANGTDGKRACIKILLEYALGINDEELVELILNKVQVPNADIKVTLSNALDLDLYDKTQYQVALDLEKMFLEYVINK